MERVGIPRHRRAHAIAAERKRPIGDRFGILEQVERYVVLQQAQFLALIQEHVAAHARQQRKRQPGEPRARGFIGPA